MTETPSVEASSIDQYLRKMESRLRRQGLSATAMSEILAELKSHMIDRVAELQQAGAPQPVQQALQAMGDPDTIADEFAGLRKLKLASRSVLPGTLLAAAWRLTVAGGPQPSLVLLRGVGIHLVRRVPGGCASEVSDSLESRILDWGQW